MIGRPEIQRLAQAGGVDERTQEREVVVLVELPTEGERLDELLYVGLTRATTELVVIAPPELVRRLGF